MRTLCVTIESPYFVSETFFSVSLEDVGLILCPVIFSFSV